MELYLHSTIRLPYGEHRGNFAYHRKQAHCHKMNGAIPPLSHTPALWWAQRQLCLPQKTGSLPQKRILQTKIMGRGDRKTFCSSLGLFATGPCKGLVGDITMAAWVIIQHVLLHRSSVVPRSFQMAERSCCALLGSWWQNTGTCCWDVKFDSDK